jgi:hypothetical protein
VLKVAFPDNGSASDSNDLHSYDPGAHQWANLGALARGRAPTPRMGHGFAPAAGRLFVFGGCLSGSARPWASLRLVIAPASHLCLWTVAYLCCPLFSTVKVSLK